MDALTTRTLQTLAVFGADYHGGQWSRLYRLQCRASALLARRGELPVYVVPGLTRQIQRSGAYAALVARYGND